MCTHHFPASCGEFERGLFNSKCSIWVRRTTGDVLDDYLEIFGGGIHSLGCPPVLCKRLRRISDSAIDGLGTASCAPAHATHMGVPFSYNSVSVLQ